MTRPLSLMLSLVLLCVAGEACHSTRKAKRKQYASVEDPSLRFEAGPPTLVYKTRMVYDTLVPILLSEDRKEIVSYPHPRDLRKHGDGKPALSQDYPYPQVLEEGYLLDNRGIGPQVAFLRLSYRQYAALEQAPSLAELQDLILDRDPLTELCDCGNRHAFSDAERQLNKLIVTDRLREVCRTLK